MTGNCQLWETKTFSVGFFVWFADGYTFLYVQRLYALDPAIVEKMKDS